MALFGLFRKKRVQNVLVLTEDGRIVPTQMEVVKGYMVDHRTSEAWALTTGEYSQVQKRGQKSMWRLVDERDAAPLEVGKGGMSKKKLSAMVSGIAKEARKAASYEIQKKQGKDKLASALGTSVVMLTALVMFLMVVQLLVSGKLQF